jgi:hypothetical protein
MKKNHYFVVSVCKCDPLGWGPYLKGCAEKFHIKAETAADNVVMRKLKKMIEDDMYVLWLDREYIPSENYVSASDAEFKKLFNEILATYHCDYSEIGP